MIRVAVTTDRFADVAQDYRDAQLEPVSLPCIRIRSASTEQLERARAQSSRTDLILITSPRVVSLLWPDRGMPDVEAATVGPSTAAAVARAGGRLGVVGDAGLDRLVDLAGDRLGDRHVTLLHAAGSDPVAMSRLRECALNLEEHIVYRTMPLAPAPTPVDAVAFASPSALAGWLLTRDLDNVVVGAIGATTASAVSRRRSPDIIAHQPSHAALAGAIAKFMEVRV